MPWHHPRRLLTIVLATVGVACSSGPSVTGEWLVGSRDSVDVTVEFLTNGAVRVHQYYVGHDTARREAVRREDSLALARSADAPTFWAIRRDSVCVFGPSRLGTSECGRYQIRDDGAVPALQIGGDAPWPRYRARQ